jgi:peptide/nickel transport system ATP-binding protein
MSLLDVTGLKIRYGDNTVVDGVDVYIERGESVGLVGESGSGKSQCALAILGLLPRQAEVSGSIEFSGQQLLGESNVTLNAVRARRIGMVFQDSMLALNPYLRIGRQLRQILLTHELAAGDAVDMRVIEMLRRVGLPDPERQFRAFPHELSGGMRQRAMIAAALICEPDLLIADEPTTALDVTVQAQILDMLEEIRDDTALLLITHDLGIVAGHCEHLVVLKKGRVVDAGQTTSIFSAPRHDHTKKMLAAAPRIDRGKAPQTARGSTVLAVEDLKVRYEVSREEKLDAVTGVNLSLREGETLSVVGESGSGKSTLVRAILGLVPIHSGIAVYAGEALQGEVHTRPLDKRREMQLVFQDPMNALNPQMRVTDIVGESLLVHAPAMSNGERAANVIVMLERVGLDASYSDRFPHQLSGGQAQRVAIARALILEPKILICDEAVAALDGSAREKVLQLLQKIQVETGLSIIFISHDLAVVRSISHRVAVMYMGRLVEVAGSDALFESPKHPYTRALIDAIPVPDPRVPSKGAPLRGEVPSLLNPPSGCVFHPRCRFAEEDCAQTRPELREVFGSRVACMRAEKIDL